MIKKIVTLILAGAVFAPVAFANGMPQIPSGQANASANDELREALFEGINEICDAYEKGPVRVYCQDAQFYGYQRFGKIAMSALENKELDAIVLECVDRFRFSESMVDYGMAMRCISVNIEGHGIKVNK